MSPAAEPEVAPDPGRRRPGRLVASLLVSVLLVVGALVALWPLVRSTRARWAFQRAEEHVAARRHAEAIEEYDLSIDLEPTRADAWGGRGRARLKVGNFIPGVLDVAHASGLDAAWIVPILEQGYQITYVVDLDRVFEALDDAETRRGRDDADVALVRGLFRFFDGIHAAGSPRDPTSLDVALDDIDAVVAARPDHAAAWALRGRILLARVRRAAPGPGRAGPLEETARSVAEALERAPELTLAHAVEAWRLVLLAEQPDLDPESVAAARASARGALDALRGLGGLGDEVRELEAALDDGPADDR